MIDDLVTSDVGVEFSVGGRTLSLSWTWLRDHARDAESYLASANQRIVSPSEVAASGGGEAHVAGDTLIVTWPEGPTAEFDAAFFSGLGEARSAVTAGHDAVPWIGRELGDRIEALDADNVIDTDDGLRTALDRLWRDGVILLRDVPIDRATTRQVIERFGYVRSTIFGDLWEFRADGDFDDTASTPLEITPHTDGTYSHDAPGLLALHCHVYEATGGENVFVDSHAIAARLGSAHLATLRTVEIPGQYIGDGSHLMAERPALRYHGERLVQVSYNHHDRAPFVVPEPTMTELYDALHEFDHLANDPELQFELAMRPGDMVIFDNWRVLHGRRAFSGERVIAGGYVNREDVESTTRLLN